MVTYEVVSNLENSVVSELEWMLVNDRMVTCLMQMDLFAMLPFGMNLDYVGNYQESNYYNLKYPLLLSSLYLSFEVVYLAKEVLMEGPSFESWGLAQDCYNFGEVLNIGQFLEETLVQILLILEHLLMNTLVCFLL